MALVKDTLKSELQKIQKNQPDTVDKAADLWANAVFTYSSAAQAGGVIPTLNKDLLKAKFLVSMNTKKFMDNLGADLLAWWTPVPWAGAGYTGVTVPSPVLLSSVLGKRILDGKVDVPDFLSTEIDKWTKTLKVTATNGTTTSVIPVS